jgi:MFS family permease
MREALKSPPIRWLLLAYLAFVAAEWGTWLAVLIYAFDTDGQAAVGLVATAQLLPAAVMAPIAPLLVARLGRPSPLVFAYGIQALTAGATAVAVLLGPSWVVYACAAALTSSIGFGRPAHATTLVAVARTPGELTAANGAGGMMDGAGIVIGPVMVGLLYALVGPGGFLLILAAVLLGACLIAVGLRVERWQSPASTPTTGVAFREALRVATDRRGPLLAIIALIAAWIAAGLLDILIIVLALGELGGGSELVAILNAALGVGAMVAGFAAARMAGSGGVVAIGAGLAIAAAAIGAAAVFHAPMGLATLLALVGAGYGLAEIGSRGLLMRLVPARSVGAVFGLTEGIYGASLALGAAVGPLLLLAVPVEAALAGIALALGVAAAILTPALLRVARRIVVPAAELETLRRVPLLAPLPVPTIEWLARSAQRLEVAGGEAVVRQGEPGDQFYAIERGMLNVEMDGHLIGQLGPGDFFGEIALLRDTPRTATVTAMTDAALIAVGRDEFLAAVTGHVVATRKAMDAVGARLGRDRGRPTTGVDGLDS